MPITKIQLRGISRVPSDRLTKDGDCAESVNVTLRETETAPVVPPTKVSETLAPGITASGIDVMYIHKTNTYTSYVGTKAYTEGLQSVLYLVAYIYNPGTQTWGTHQIHKIGTLGIVSVTSIGNMLICALSDGKTYYFLCKDYDYMSLGCGLPRPDVSFYVSKHEEETFGAAYLLGDLFENAPSYAKESAKAFWDYVMGFQGVSGAESAQEFYKAIKGFVWDTYYSERRNYLLGAGYFSAPVFVRYALKMRDGSYVNVSEPIVLTGDGKNQFISKVLFNVGRIDADDPAFYLQCVLTNVFSASVSVQMDNASYWSDLIESVDVFVSTDILSPKPNSDLDEVSIGEETTMDVGPRVTMIGHDASAGYRIENGVDDFEEKMTEKGNFYLLKSFPITELPASSSRLNPVSQDDLLVSTRLADPQSHTISGHGKLSSYNNRLVSGTQRVVLSPGHGEPQALLRGISPIRRYEIVYHLRDDNGEHRVVCGYSYDGDENTLLGYVSYPDARCYKAELYVSELYQGQPLNTTIYNLPMKEHPRLDASYGFWGLDDVLNNTTGGRTRVIYDDYVPRPDDDATFLVENRLALSEMDNPFVFPLGQMQQFSEKIIGALPVTIALSTGQFGQFPLYVFTEGGVWTIPIDSEGKMAAHRPVSRDVAIDGTIAQLDQAIVFISKQGVMLLQGSKISCLSQIMNGKNFVPSSGLISAIESYSAASLIVDQVPFITFVKGSVPAYDYVGQRIIFFNQTYPSFQYVFSLASQTWHRIKLTWSAPMRFRVLNSFPDCLVFFGAQVGGDIVDFSTILDADSDTTALPGLVVTRDLNFGDNDAYKTIKRIKIRGDRFPEASPWKYVLLGSNDRKNYHVLHSLRGPSWKFYRIAIMTTMKQAGRISYIELEWEPRFSDRIR